MSDSVRPQRRQPNRLLCLGHLSDKNTEMSCHFLLQGIFLTQGWNLCLLLLLHWQVDSLPSEPPGKPDIEGHNEWQFYSAAAAVTSVVSDSVRPHRRQPTRLRRPGDSPGKNTGVGCHFLLQCKKVKSESEVAQSCPTLSDPMDCSLPGSSIHGIFQARVLEWGAIAFSVGSLNRSEKTHSSVQC